VPECAAKERHTALVVNIVEYKNAVDKMDSRYAPFRNPFQHFKMEAPPVYHGVAQSYNL
jgi:hypothetical protein